MPHAYHIEYVTELTFCHTRTTSKNTKNPNKNNQCRHHTIQNPHNVLRFIKKIFKLFPNPLIFVEIYYRQSDQLPPQDYAWHDCQWGTTETSGMMVICLKKDRDWTEWNIDQMWCDIVSKTTNGYSWEYIKANHSMNVSHVVVESKIR